MKKGKTNIQFQGVGFAITITGLLKVLWNKVFPELFGWKKITYWQSIMLYLICKALFDFRYNIKDSFNFGNNNINSDGVSKKAPIKANDEEVKEAEVPNPQETEEVNTAENVDVEIDVEEAEVEEVVEQVEESKDETTNDDDEVIEFAKKEKKGK